MKVVAFNGSPRKEGNTVQSLEVVRGGTAGIDIETECRYAGKGSGAAYPATVH